MRQTVIDTLADALGPGGGAGQPRTYSSPTSGSTPSAGCGSCTASTRPSARGSSRPSSSTTAPPSGSPHTSWPRASPRTARRPRATRPAGATGRRHGGENRPQCTLTWYTRRPGRRGGDRDDGRFAHSEDLDQLLGAPARRRQPRRQVTRWDLDAFYAGSPPPSTGTAGAPASWTAWTCSTRRSSASRRARPSHGPAAAAVPGVRWAALEDAGHVRAGSRGTACGVFVGVNRSDYQPDLRAALNALAQHRAAMPARILVRPHRLQAGPAGPARRIDTACSTSLVAIHLACQSLRTGDATWRWPAASAIGVPHSRLPVSAAGRHAVARRPLPHLRRARQRVRARRGRRRACVLKRLDDADRRRRPDPRR